MTGVDVSGLPQTITCPGLIEAVEAAVAWDRSERAYLGASVIGEPCERRLWYGFRWATEPERLPGRILRLFRTGHRQEAIIIEDLRRAGLDISDRDPETGEQWDLRTLGGHFRCHPDGYATGVPSAPVVRHLLEIKTHGSNSYRQLVKFGVAVSKPEHVTQMDTGMHLAGLTRALYVAINKNTEELYIERIRVDLKRTAMLVAKAERIIVADQPPERINDTAESFHCRFCPAKSVCHLGATPRRHCRTCIHSTPQMTGDSLWWCDHHGCEITTETQRDGCSHQRMLPSLIDGELMHVDEEAETLTYRMGDGSTWIDGAKKCTS